MTPPEIRLPDKVRHDLDASRPGLADEFERMLAGHVRPCIAVTASRVSANPLRRSILAKMVGLKESAPILPPTASKFGGIPYSEEDEDWGKTRFLGQIDLAEATAILPAGEQRLRGLLRVDIPAEQMARVRWFTEPSLRRACPVSCESKGSWEARLQFALSWTLPEGNAFDALWPLEKLSWLDYNRVEPRGFNEDGFDEFHRMLGHKSGGLEEHYDFTPAPGCSSNIDDYECLWRITYDNESGFAWGTNWVYVIVPREDLQRGDLSRVTVTGANS